MECDWFFCVGLRFGAGTIAVLGILHPLVYWRAARRFRSELFLLIYLLVGVWSVLSVMLLVGVLTDTPWLLTVWYSYTIVFVVVMVVLLIFVTAGFCILDMKNSAIIPILGILYYILTLYFVCVVYTHKKHMRSARDLRQHEHVNDPPAEWLARQMDSSGTRRGRCAVPRAPPAGVYVVQAAASVGGGHFAAMRLLVYCRPGHAPRHRRHVDCYSGGWNLPLPQCVPVDETISEEVSEEEIEAGSRKCVARPPPEYGYYQHEPGQFAQAGSLSLVVACTPMHFLVGRPRVTCRDGVWDRPLPKCVLVDSTVCAVGRKRRMRHTCLGSELYAGTYTCDGGLVPHGGVVEPACREGFYVWGPFSYMHCMDGRWVPAASPDIECISKVDIYRHYEIEERNRMTASTEEDDETEAVITSPVTAVTTAASKQVTSPPTAAAVTAASSEQDAATAADAGASAGRRRTDPSDTRRSHITKTNIRISRSEAGAALATAAAAGSGVALYTNKRKSHNENDNTTRMSIWKTRSNESNESPSAYPIKADIWKFRSDVADPLSSSSTTRTNIWKSRNDTGGWKNTKTNIWKYRHIVAEPLNSSSTTKTIIWKSRNDTGGWKSTKMNIRKSNSDKWSTTHSITTLSRKLSRINMWKGQSEARELVTTEPTGANMWGPHRQAADRDASARAGLWKSRREADHIDDDID